MIERTTAAMVVVVSVSARYCGAAPSVAVGGPGKPHSIAVTLLWITAESYIAQELAFV